MQNLHTYIVLMPQLKCSLTACLKPANTGKDRPCSLLSKTVDGKLTGCVVLGRQETYLLFLPLWKTIWIPRLGSGLLVSGIDLKFTCYSKIFLYHCSRCTERYTLAYTRAQTTIWGALNVRCTIVYANMLLGARKNVYHDF